MLKRGVVSKSHVLVVIYLREGREWRERG